jgi:hypothetical protein
MQRLNGQIGFETGVFAPWAALAFLKLVLRRP